MSPSPVTVSCRNVWKVFGPHPQRAIEQCRAGASKARVLEETGHVVAVRDISFDVAAGEIFVVMGLSGSGKSTLIRCISRLIDPSAGQVLIDGVDVAGMNATELREVRRHKLAMVFQHFGLFPHRRVIDNVAYGLEVQGVTQAERHRRAREVLELVSLPGWENHYPQELSGGMQQRVGLARALAVDPEILLFDEPFSALDPLIRREMQDELLSLQKRLCKSLIFITHDFLEALKLGDQIAIMRDGEIVQAGRPEEIVAHPLNEYVAAFTRDAPRAKILNAASVMTPLAGAIPADENIKSAFDFAIPAEMKLEKIIPILARHDRALLVVDAAGQPVGTIDQRAVLLAVGDADQRQF